MEYNQYKQRSWRTGTAVCSLLLLTSCAGKVGESICILPQGYSGPVLIIYGQKEGDPPEIERGLHVYRIPSTGVVRTRNQFQRSIETLEYYYEDSAGVRSPVHLKKYFYLPGEDTSKPTREGYYCFYEMAGNYGGTRFRHFAVGDEQNADSLSRLVDKLVAQLVNNELR